MTTVIIKFEIEGFHHYPGAPAEVNFLSHNHRHVFNITCGYKVDDLNREREIFICRDKVKKWLSGTYTSKTGYVEFGPMSCEMIANRIVNHWSHDNMIWCEVWEESTGGARIDL